MIHYNVWFSFKKGTAEPVALKRVAAFLDEQKQSGRIHDFMLLRNQAEAAKTKLARFHALISFVDQEQFVLPFKQVEAIGVHSGPHGLMIENVDTFIVEVFEELPGA